jgi:hypothetical protein
MPAAAFAAGNCEPSGKGFSDSIKLTRQMPSTVMERQQALKRRMREKTLD